MGQNLAAKQDQYFFEVKNLEVKLAGWKIKLCVIFLALGMENTSLSSTSLLICTVV